MRDMAILRTTKRPAFPRGAIVSELMRIDALLFRLGLALLDHFRLDRYRLRRRDLRDHLGACRGDADDDAMRILFDLHALWQLQIRNADLLVRAEVRDVDFDRVGDGVGETFDVKLAHLPVEDAALFDADRVAAEMDRNGQADHLVHHHAHEIDVRHAARDRVHLHVLDHGVALLIGAGHLQQKDRTDAVLALLNQIDDRLALDGDRHRLFVTAIDDRRDLVFLTQLLRVLFSRALATGNFQGDLSHDAETPSAV